MREILFRGKRIDNGEWIEGFFAKDNNRSHIVRNKHKTGVLFFVDEVDHETVGQYTGLKDKNGKRIFEGDVVKVEGKACEVKYMLGQFFVGINMPVAYKRFDCEVIGNIHDNPKLLEVDHDEE